MPSTLPGSFASAAAGNGTDATGRSSSRAEHGSFGDWTRRSNGATQTFRRSSTAATNTTQMHQRDSISSAGLPGTYVPPHISAGRNGSTFDTRYSKSQLLGLFREQKDARDLEDDVSDLYVGEAMPGLSNGITTPKWARRDESKNDYSAPGPEICWERNGIIEPLGLVEMTDEEKELFTTSVNSPLKGPSQSSTREAAPREGTANRKISISQIQGGASQNLGLGSPTATRSVNRRRDTGESYPFPRDLLASPSSSGALPRDEPSETVSPFGLLRRRTDNLEAGSDRHIAEESGKNAGEFNTSGIGSSFGSFKRSATNPLSASPAAGASNWSATSQSSAIPSLASFGSLGLGGHNTASGAKRPDVGPSRESRFRGLMSKTKADERVADLQEKQSIGSIGKVEGVNEDVERESAEDLSLGTMAGRQSDSADLLSRQTGFAPTQRQRFEDEQRLGDSDRGSDSLAQAGIGDNRFHDESGGTSMQGYRQFGGHQEELLSPSFANPYTSPQQQTSGMRDLGSDELGMGNLHLPGLGEFQKQVIHDPSGQGAFTARRDLSRAPSYDLRQADRGPYSNSSASRAFQSLGGLGGLGGFGSPEPWSASLGSGTPLREKGPFVDLGGQVAGSPVSLQSPSKSGTEPGAIGRGGRLGSLFPTAMQEQMRNEQPRGQRDERALPTVSESLESLTRTSSLRRDIDSPFRVGQFKFEDFSRGVETGPTFHTSESALGSEHLSNTSGQPSQQTTFAQLQQQYPSQASAAHAASVGTPSSHQPPAAQQKTMVMPDRIRWIYRDPQGNTQGPWSGLEMHDWYRAGFFSPELLVKKAEDSDYEPLAQLIRRIGNSREPFLVPQIGIPGPPNTQSSANWPSQTLVPSTSTATAAPQPPFAGSFPSFGTTLTAEQQNALERRKQEEQYLMARQKEHLAQQQLHARQMQGQHGVHPQQLQHHSSAQSLQSQPSYGSMTSPNGFQASPPQNMNQVNSSIAGGFEGSFRLSGGIGPGGSGIDSLGDIREEDSSTLFERLDLESDPQRLSDGQQSIGGRLRYQEGGSFEERAASILADRALLERQQAEEDQLAQSRDRVDPPSVNERLREFQELRGKVDTEDRHNSRDILPLATTNYPRNGARQEESTATITASLSLTEQVEKAASSKQSPATSSWARVEATASDAAPPQSASPLPAPAARRGRPNVADALTAESISQSQSPAEETLTSSLAPWAKETIETQKQPSLREIQEVEARKAAKQEEVAAATRRAALEREMANLPPPPAPGLPSSSTWGSNESPLTASADAPSAWTKPVTAKATTVPNGPAKKSLQQIQAEEEAAARKKKASAANNASIANHVAGAAQAMSSGKRYADLASKVASPPPSSAGAWTTVGASGKAKAPPPSTAPPVAARSLSATNVAGVTNPVRPKPTATNSKTSLATAKQNAQDEVKRWATSELRPDLDKNIQVEEFVQTLLNFPSDTDMITEVVHQNSSTIDSRHFAEEFVRRRGLAEKGKTDATAGGVPHYSHQLGETKSGGWNEVARKGSSVSTNTAKDEANGSFKIVAAKKKGKR